MSGPVPKDPALRQRRNRTTSAARLEAGGERLRQRRVPALPKIVQDTDAEGNPVQLEWHPMTRAWWRDVWRSPMAPEFLQADVHGLYRLALLVNAYWRAPSTALAAEIRLEQQTFGLTPLDRRRLQWEVSRAEEATTKRRPAPQPAPNAQPIDDPRSVLKIVGGSK